MLQPSNDINVSFDPYEDDNEEEDDDDDCSSESDPETRQRFVEILSHFIAEETGHAPQSTNDFKTSLFYIDVKAHARAWPVRNWWIPANHPIALLMKKHAYRYGLGYALRELDAGRYGKSSVYNDATIQYTFRRLREMFQLEGIELENFLSSDEEEEEEEVEHIPPLPPLPKEQSIDTTIKLQYSIPGEGSKKAD